MRFSASSVRSIMPTMEVFIIILCWIVVPIVAAIVASNKGRSGAGWFFLCLLLTPLAILVLLALPTLKPPEPQFEPTAVLKGFPYRLRENGTVDAMMTGGLIHFHNVDLFRAAAEGRDADSAMEAAGSPRPDENLPEESPSGETPQERYLRLERQRIGIPVSLGLTMTWAVLPFFPVLLVVSHVLPVIIGADTWT